jgi:hypothetical protein
VFQSVTPHANVPAPREHIPVSVTARSRQTKAAKQQVASGKSVHAKQQGKSSRITHAAHGRALGRQKHIAVDASVASHHVHVTRHVHPVHPATSHRIAAQAKPKPHPLPGPTDHGPPAGKKH